MATLAEVLLEDYYRVLGVDPAATHQEIRQAYRRKALQHHPDRGGSHEAMVQLNVAFAVLANTAMRAEYDRVRGEQQRAAQARSRPPDDGAQAGARSPDGAADFREYERTARSWGGTYPASDGIDEYISDFLRSVASDFRATKYSTTRFRGMPVKVAESGTGIAFSLGGAALVLVFVVPVVMALPCAAPPLIGLLLAAGFGGGAYLHQILNTLTGGSTSPPPSRGPDRREPGPEAPRAESSAPRGGPRRANLACPKCGRRGEGATWCFACDVAMQ